MEREPRNFKLRQTEISPGGYASYERVDTTDVDDFIAGAKEVTKYIAEQSHERTEGIREAIRARQLTPVQRKELSKALAAALAVASPQAAENSAPVLESAIDSVSEVADVRRIDLREIALADTEQEERLGRFESELRERVQWWQTNKAEYFDGAMALAEKPTVGNRGLTRADYIRTATEFNEHPVWGGLSRATQDELRRLLPALAVQESGYHNGLVSKDGAVGILQQIPDAISHLSDYSVAEVQRSLEKQVEIAGRYFINAHYVMFESERWGVGEIAKTELLRRHNGEEYEREFLPRVLLNGYNVGPAGMAREIRDYFDVPEHRQNNLTGAELFFDIIEWGRSTKEARGSNFGDDARNYVPKIEAAALLMEAREKQGGGIQNARVAYTDF